MNVTTFDPARAKCPERDVAPVTFVSRYAPSAPLTAKPASGEKVQAAIRTRLLESPQLPTATSTPSRSIRERSAPAMSGVVSAPPFTSTRASSSVLTVNFSAFRSTASSARNRAWPDSAIRASAPRSTVAFRAVKTAASDPVNSTAPVGLKVPPSRTTRRCPARVNPGTVARASTSILKRSVAPSPAIVQGFPARSAAPSVSVKQFVAGLASATLPWRSSEPPETAISATSGCGETLSEGSDAFTLANARRPCV